MITIAVATAFACLFALALTALILFARRLLVPVAPIAVSVNGQRELAGRFGDRLLSLLGANGIALPSACAGAGTCGLCRITLPDKTPAPSPIEQALLSHEALRDGIRLACQQTLRAPLAISVDRGSLAARRWEGAVLSNRALSPLIREIRIAAPPAGLAFEPGDFVQVEVAPSSVFLGDIVLDAEPARRLGLARLAVRSVQTETRAYSLANRPGETDVVSLMVRLALAPDGSDETVPPGIVSSWLCARRTGDTVALAGPFGDFHIADATRELVFVGGGVGMAPLRAMIHRQVAGEHARAISFFFGARSREDLLHADEFGALAHAVDGFDWTPALSEPDATWHGRTGFIHEVLQRDFLDHHPAPDRCDFYLCGPPLMIRATITALHRAGVRDAHIHRDDFD